MRRCSSSIGSSPFQYQTLVFSFGVTPSNGGPVKLHRELGGPPRNGRPCRSQYRAEDKPDHAGMRMNPWATRFELMNRPVISPNEVMPTGTVPSPKPTPAPGASNVVIEPLLARKKP